MSAKLVNQGSQYLHCYHSGGCKFADIDFLRLQNDVFELLLPSRRTIKTSHGKLHKNLKEVVHLQVEIACHSIVDLCLQHQSVSHLADERSRIVT